MRRKIWSLLSAFILIFYAIIIGIFVFIPRSNLNLFISSQILFAHFFAFPLLFGGFILILSLMMVLLRMSDKLWRTFWLGIAFISLIFAFGGTEFTYKLTEPVKGTIVKMVSWNVLNHFTAEHVKQIFGKYDVDIAVFPELDDQEEGVVSDKWFSELFKEANLDIKDYDFFMSPEIPGEPALVTIFVKKSFGKYEIIKDENINHFGTIYLKSIEANNPDIIGLHTSPPLPGMMQMWREDLALVADYMVKEYPNAILMGDFNANKRHASFNKISSHEDALLYLHPLERGTWHVKLPQVLRTPIDHILMPVNQFEVQYIELFEFTESDHNGIYLELSKK